MGNLDNLLNTYRQAVLHTQAVTNQKQDYLITEALWLEHEALKEIKREVSLLTVTALLAN